MRHYLCVTTLPSCLLNNGGLIGACVSMSTMLPSSVTTPTMNAGIPKIGLQGQEVFQLCLSGGLGAVVLPGAITPVWGQTAKCGVGARDA